MARRMKFSDLFSKAVTLLENAEVDYLLIGGVAIGVWGKPRVTQDVDFIVFIPREDIEKIIKKGKILGFQFKKVAHPQFPEAGVFKLYYGIYHVDFIIASTELEKIAFKRKVKVRIFGKEVFVPSKEDLILLKLIPGRGIDIFDAENIAKRYSGKLDKKYLQEWAQKLSDQAQDMRIYKEVQRLLKL